MNALIDAIKEEDRLLRRYVTALPRAARDAPGVEGALSCKEALGHIAFWDDFTVEFFQCKLDKTSCKRPAPTSFEERSREEMRRLGPLPFGEVLARYLESTGALIAFLVAHWDELTEREKHDFWVPLKHRRHHRISLAHALDLEQGLDPDLSGDEMTADS